MIQHSTKAVNLLKQLEALALQLTHNQFASALPAILGGTVGQHMRHVLEFFEMLLEGTGNGLVAYDDRPHNALLEEDKNTACKQTRAMAGRIQRLTKDAPLKVRINFEAEEGSGLLLQSSVARELAYTIEHAIHHMAMIKMAVNQHFPHIELPHDFGMAGATLRYRKSQDK